MSSMEDPDCPCPSDGATFFNENTSSESNSSADKRDAGQCIANCIETFIRGQWPDYNTFSDIPGDACTWLSSTGINKELWKLYWCDSKYCGVSSSKVEDDPNVDNIINNCQNRYYPSITDPGPPPPEFSCNAWADRHANQPCRVMTNKSGASTAGTATLLLATPSQVTSLPLSTASEDPDVPGVSSNTNDSTLQSSTSDSLSAGVKAAVAVCAVLALLTFLGLGIFFCRRQARRKRPFSTSRLKADIRHHHGLPPHPADSPTPLISPTNSASGALAPLTPPLRLRDRKLLPSILRPISRSSSPPLTSLSPPISPNQANHQHQLLFTSSPICMPTVNKLTPRHERTPNVYGIPVPPSTLSAMSTGPRSSFGSFAASGSTTANSSLRDEKTTNTSHGTTKMTSTGHGAPRCTGPSTPNRPPRPHDTALEIPDLVSPVSPLPVHSPNPNRGAAVSPTSPVSPISLYSHTVPSLTAAPADLTSEAHALRELTKEYALEKRESWSSWTTGGGGPGVALSPVRSKQATGPSKLQNSGTADWANDGGLPATPPPLLKEQDLESLGGKY